MSKWIEKRLRIRRSQDVKEGYVKMNPNTIKYLGIEDVVEVVIGGKKRLHFKVFSFSSIPPNEIWGNNDELQNHGIADNTIATCRRPLKRIELAG